MTRQARQAQQPQPEKSETEQAREKRLEGARAIQLAAELVDAMMLAVEVMIQDQKRLMREGGTSEFLRDNELWHGIATFTAATRTHMFDVGKAAEAIETAGMAEGRAAA